MDTEQALTLNATTISVEKALTLESLVIPHYQRPYKWQPNHVAQLIDDIERFQKQPAYRLGSLVLHDNHSKESKEEHTLDIVDGQQRTITLALFIRAYAHFHSDSGIQNERLRLKLKNFKDKGCNFPLTHPTSQTNAAQNLSFIRQRLSSIKEETMLFLLEKCEFVKFTISDLSSAFQLFDSQNARGKELDPHDLLKAYHLRAFSAAEESSKEAVTQRWEDTDTEKLKDLFQKYLYRIKGWSNKQSARFFTKSHVDSFKGIDLSDTQLLPFTNIYRIADAYTRKYNGAIDREVDGGKMRYPFQLDMPVVNGRMFFEMINHYLEKSETLWETVTKELVPDKQAAKVLQCLDNYEGRHRTGDIYLRQLFDAALLQYVDKFGHVELESVICHLFVWVYRLRIGSARIYMATMDNHAFSRESYLHTIRKALRSKEVTAMPMPVTIDINYWKTDDLRKTFQAILGDKIFSNGGN